MKALKFKALPVIYLILLCNLLFAQTSYWKTVDLGTTVDLYGANSKFVTGNSGKIFYTSNGGLNWTEQQSNTANTLRSVASNSSNSVTLAVGSNGTILRTTNNGLLWSAVNSGTSNTLYSVTFSTINYCFAVGAGGTILKSTNAGVNWVTMYSGVVNELHSVLTSGTSLFACGANGVIRYLPTILDTVWQSRNVGSNIDLNSIFAFTGITTVGNAGKIFTSSNGGANWQNVSSPTVNDLTTISNNYIAGYGGTILNYVSGTWVNIPGISTADLLGSSPVTGSVLGNPFLFVVGKNGTLLTAQSDTSYYFRDLRGNNIRSWFTSRGIIDNDIRSNNTPGFEWPAGTGKFALYTGGLSIGAYVNSGLRLATASYSGEYRLGYCINGVFLTNSNFRYYRVSRGDNQNTNRDWAEWGLMVPFGAPFNDINNNGTFEPSIDVPGVKDASQTLFVCLTDADPTAHTPSEGFGGGTLPLGAEVHLTAWAYDNPGYQDMQILKWVVINKNTQAWDSTIFTIVCDPDLGDALDDYIGCDTSRDLGYCYNADNNDGDGTGRTYGLNPPAVGIAYLNCANSSARLSSINYFTGSGAPGPICERDPSTAAESYRYMKGLKKDGTPWVNIQTSLPTKFCYPGDPETLSGWTEFAGKVENCSGSLIGPHVIPSIPGDRRFIISYRPANQIVNPGDTQIVLATQLIARGSNHKNSVSLLKQQTDIAKQLCQNGFVIGISPISTEVPEKFSLYQNYPNPFNPTTKIKFAIPSVETTRRVVLLKIYDALGKEVQVLVNEQLNPGTYEVNWDASNFPSGVYFYRLTSGEYTESKKMVLIK